VALALAGVGGETLFERLTTGAPSVPMSESEVGRELLAEHSAAGATLTLAVRGVDVTRTDVSRPVAAARAELLTIEAVASVIDPYVVPAGPDSPAAAPLVAADGAGFLVVVDLDHGLTDEVEAAALEDVERILRGLPERLRTVAPDATGQVGGISLIVTEITGQVEEDLTTGEVIALPIALLVMVMVFGGFMAAAMPMAGALASVAGGVGSVFVLSHFMEMDASVVNVVTVLGLGLSIDYGLLIVSRFREELTRLVADDAGESVRRRRGDGAVEAALRTTMQTAGRTVAFSAVTIAISICGLLVFTPEILRAFGAASVAVILIAFATALTLVPALLRLGGRRLVRPGLVGRVPGLRWLLARTGDVTHAEGVFSRLAGWVQRRPWRVLGGLADRARSPGAPGRLHRAAQLDHRAAPGPVGAAGLRAGDRDPVPGVGLACGDGRRGGHRSTRSPLGEPAGTDRERRCRRPGRPVGPYVVVGVRPDTADQGGPVARQVVRDVRDLDAPFPTWVTGRRRTRSTSPRRSRTARLGGGDRRAGHPRAALPDDRLGRHPDQGAAHQRDLAVRVRRRPRLGLPVRPPVRAARVHPDRGDRDVRRRARRGVRLRARDGLRGVPALPDQGAARRGSLERRGGAAGAAAIGRIITSAALIIIVVFTGFIFGELLVIKEVGFALAIAVLIDATLVRMLLVPATMTLLGKYNWWAPKPLRRVHRRVAVRH
jgi:putative drug exporter of the RND superfamily